MQKLFFIIAAIVIIIVQCKFTAYQMRGADTVDTEKMQRYVEYINATEQLNKYERE